MIYENGNLSELSVVDMWWRVPTWCHPWSDFFLCNVESDDFLWQSNSEPELSSWLLKQLKSFLTLIQHYSNTISWLSFVTLKFHFIHSCYCFHSHLVCIIIESTSYASVLKYSSSRSSFSSRKLFTCVLVVVSALIGSRKNVLTHALGDLAREDTNFVGLGKICE